MSFDSNYDVNTIKPWDTTPSVFGNSCPVQQRSYSPLWQMSEIPIHSSVVSISLICIKIWTNIRIISTSHATNHSLALDINVQKKSVKEFCENLVAVWNLQ